MSWAAFAELGNLFDRRDALNGQLADIENKIKVCLEDEYDIRGKMKQILSMLKPDGCCAVEVTEQVPAIAQTDQQCGVSHPATGRPCILQAGHDAGHKQAEPDKTVEQIEEDKKASEMARKRAALSIIRSAVDAEVMEAAYVSAVLGKVKRSWNRAPVAKIEELAEKAREKLESGDEQNRN